MGDYATIQTKSGDKYKLTAAERELIISGSDAEDTLHVFCDSLRWRRRLQKVFDQLGITAQPVGAGFEADIAVGVLRFRVPRRATAAQRKALERSRKARAARASTGGDR